MVAGSSGFRHTRIGNNTMAGTWNNSLRFVGQGKGDPPVHPPSFHSRPESSLLGSRNKGPEQWLCDYFQVDTISESR